MPTSIAYDPDSDKYLGTNDQGHTEVWDREDVPQALKLGRVQMHHPSEDPPVDPPHRVFDPHSDEEKAKGPPVRVAPTLEGDQFQLVRPNHGARPEGEQRPATPAPRADAEDTGFSGGSPGEFFGDALNKTATARLPEQPLHANPSIPGVKPNSGNASKVPGASDIAPGASVQTSAQPSPGYGPGLDDAALKRAQEQARGNHLMAGIGRAGATIGAAFGRVAPDHSYFDEQDKNAGQPVADLMTRRGAMDQDQARQGRAQALGDASRGRQTTLEMSDPSSDRSQRARQVLQQANPEFAKRFTPAEFERMSANDIGSLGELGKTVLTHTMELEKADKEKKAGIDAADHERVEREHFEGGQRALDRQNRAATAATGRTAHLEDRAAERAEKEQEKKGAEQAKEQKAYDELHDAIEHYRALHRKYGSKVLPDTEQSRLESVANDVTLKIKNLEGLSRINPREMEMFERMAPRPSTGVVSDLLGSSSGPDKQEAMLDELQGMVDRKFPEAAGRRGGGSGDGKIAVIDPNGIPGRIPAANLEKALKKGFKRAAP